MATNDEGSERTLLMATKSERLLMGGVDDERVATNEGGSKADGFVASSEDGDE
ncbi:hypothetical protein BVRB_4g085460 [Beta vulgaris subsp. vulgaris]|nr:hypothetical protein BVRB_4g085460 [Beta vulgaris subsp. vulgaris]